MNLRQPKMTTSRILYAIGASLLFLVALGASMMWPELVIWVAWMLAALLMFSGRVLGEELEEVKENRDKWRDLEGVMERARIDAERLVSRLADALEAQRTMLDKRDAEIQRLKDEYDQKEAERLDACDFGNVAQQRVERYEALFSWLKEKGYITVALVDQFMKLAESEEA